MEIDLDKKITVDGVDYYPERKEEKLFDMNDHGVTWTTDYSSAAWNTEYSYIQKRFCLKSTGFTRDEQYAKDMAEALQVVWELKMCDGVVNPVENTIQWTIDAAANPDNWESNDFKYSFFPFFDTMSECRAAIEKVGKDRIIKAIETWHKV